VFPTEAAKAKDTGKRIQSVICTGEMRLENIVTKSLCDKRARMTASMRVKYIERL